MVEVGTIQVIANIVFVDLLKAGCSFLPNVLRHLVKDHSTSTSNPGSDVDASLLNHLDSLIDLCMRVTGFITSDLRSGPDYSHSEAL